jgi:hypothetical protein
MTKGLALLAFVALAACSPAVPTETPLPTTTPLSILPTVTSPPAGTEEGVVCTLAGGGVVEQGWSGKDTGSNSCNQCRCLSAGLACTKMACPVASAPAKPDDIKASKPSGDMGETFLSLPFDVEQYPDGMMPMGETIQHSPPNGHPGIDFQWLFPAKITVALEGIVGDITEEIHPVDGEIIYTVRVISGDYGVSYEVYDLYEFNPELKIGDPIAKGQQLGIPQVVHAERRMMH